LLIASGKARAQGTPAPRGAISVERAVGRATLHEDVTPRHARQLALDAAFADAIQQATGLHIASLVDYTTEEREGAIRERFSRIIRETARGTVVRYELIAEGWRDESTGIPGATIEVAIRAWVRPAEAGRTSAFDLQLALNATKFFDRGSAEASDELVMRVTSSTDAYLTVFLVTDDSVEVLFPNRYVPEVRVSPGIALEIPSARFRNELGLRLRTTLPSGVPVRTERLTVVATRAPMPFPGVAKRLTGDLRTVPTIRDTFDTLARWLLTIPVTDRAVTDATYEIVRGSGGQR
jgi:hypothetical protein